MATHHGKEGVVTAGGTAVGELTSFNLETTADVVENTKLADPTKSFTTGRTSFSGSLEMNYDESDAVVLMRVLQHGHPFHHCLQKLS